MEFQQHNQEVEEAPTSPLISKVLSSTTNKKTFKDEDTYIISHLKNSEKNILNSLKQNLPQDTKIWNTPLPTSDVILLKFLRARDFKLHETLTMITKTLAWRQTFHTDNILNEDLNFQNLENLHVAYMHRRDKLGHPVCYNAYGVFKDLEIYERFFGDEEKLDKFLRWRVQVMEKGVMMLDFVPGGINSLIQVTDLKDMPKKELRGVSNCILSLFQDNYPEMVARKIFVNVPWYFSLLYSMFSPFLTQRTKNKFVISKEGNTAETLYKYIRPEDIPVQYGGLSRPDEEMNGPPKPASEFSVKGGEKVNIQIEGIEAGATITWDIVVGGWELDYSAEFVPNVEGSYIIAVEKPRRMTANDEAVRNSYTAKDAGNLVLSVDNSSSRKKKVAAYRYIVSKSSSTIMQ